MNFNYQFCNLLGTVYRRGNLIFSPDGNTLFSPVGNKISAFDLKTHKSQTLNIEGRFDYTTLALSPNGVLLLAANEDGEVHLISLISKTILQRLRINRQVSALSFRYCLKILILHVCNIYLLLLSRSYKFGFNIFIKSKNFKPQIRRGSHLEKLYVYEILKTKNCTLSYNGVKY